MARRRDIMRWGAALTAFVYLSAWMLGFAHNISERHVVCAEHGDLVHADHGDHAHDSTDVVVAVVEIDDAHPSLDALPGHDDHDHCAIGPFFRNDDDLVVGSSYGGIPVVELTYIEPQRSYAEANRPPPVSLLALAPKTSPPNHA